MPPPTDVIEPAVVNSASVSGNGGRVAVSTKVAYGLGGLTDFFFLNFITAMAVPIFAIALKMDPFLVSVALAIPKVIGAITDPMAGFISDNARTRWGRRKPFILAGGLIGVVLMPLVWVPPAQTSWGMFLWLAVLLTCFAAAYSFFAIPYGALGFQLSTNYDERTRVLAWKGYIQVIGTFSSGWFYWACLHPGFGNEVIGVRWVSAGIALLMLVGVVATVWACPEATFVSAQQPKIPLGPALRLTLRDRPFLLLQAAVLVVAVGTGCEGLIGNYVHIYYTCQGSKELASLVTGLGGSLTVLSNFVALPLGLWVSTRMGKRTGALVGLFIALGGISLLPFTLVPESPYRIIVSWVIIAMGMPCASLLFGSMTADITDVDELETGMRREGMYVAVSGFLGKIASIITLLLGGWLPHLAGYNDPNATPNLHQLDWMRWMLIGIQAMALLGSIALIWRYPITRARSEEIRRQLEARKQSKSASVHNS